jgi:hypothetical protein
MKKHSKQRRWTGTDAFRIGDEIFYREAQEKLSPDQLARIQEVGSYGGVTGFADIAPTRTLLSEAQRQRLTAYGIDMDKPPSLKRPREVIEYHRTLAGYREGYTFELPEEAKEAAEKGYLIEEWWMPFEAYVYILVVLVFRDTEEVIAHWLTDW